MRIHRPMRGLRRDQRNRLMPLRLVLEPLEARRLLAGIHVSVYVDQDNSRSFDPISDQAAPDRLVYIDLNTNGLHDADEPLAISDQSGSAFFAELEPGDYSIGLLTNPRLQTQIEPVGLSQPVLISSSDTLHSFIATDDHQIVWTLDSSGVARPELGPSDLPAAVYLGAIVARGEVLDDRFTAITQAEAGWQKIEFELRTGQLVSRPLAVADGFSASAETKPLSLVEVDSQTIVLWEHAGRRWITQRAADGSDGPPAAAIPTSAYALTRSPGMSQVAALVSSLSGGSQLSLLDPQQGFVEVASFALDQYAAAVTVAGDGKFAFVTLSGGGVLAIAIDGQSLSLAAILHEATSPVVSSSSDGRIVSLSVRNPLELITWDSRQWLPLARTQLPSGSGSIGPPAVAVEHRGEQLLALAGGSLHRVDMSQPQPLRVVLGKPDSTAHVRLGVRSSSSSPQLQRHVVQRTLVGGVNATDSFHLTEILSTELEGNRPLWFELDVPAQHGTLVSLGGGHWKYVPEPDYFGEDQAQLLMFDGQQSTLLVLQWDVTPTRGTSISSYSAGGYVLPENAEHGTQLGPVTIVEPGEVGSYEIVSSDPRFEVYDGYLYFITGEVDYETEPQISFIITASDFYSEVMLSTSVTVSILDVNERPVSLLFSGGQVPENEPGAIVGNVRVADPDARAEEYAIYIFDSRFTLVGNTLKLAAGVALDYETEPVVHLSIAATDGTHEIFTTVAIDVLDREEGTVQTSSVQLDSNEIQEFVLGASVGLVTVQNPRDPSYQFSVSDARFEVVGSLLKLRDNQQVSISADQPLSLTVTASGNDGDQASASFPISISANQSPYHNSSIPEDVNGDGYVSAIDVLIIVNSLNLKGTHAVPNGGLANGEPPSQMPDVNHDGVISPVDALLIINHINRNYTVDANAAASGGRDMPAEGEPHTPVPTTSGSPSAAPESDSERRRRENLSIDAELELLLDQLAQSNRSTP